MNNQNTTPKITNQPDAVALAVMQALNEDQTKHGRAATTIKNKPMLLEAFRSLAAFGLVRLKEEAEEGFENDIYPLVYFTQAGIAFLQENAE